MLTWRVLPCVKRKCRLKARILKTKTLPCETPAAPKITFYFNHSSSILFRFLYFSLVLLPLKKTNIICIIKNHALLGKIFCSENRFPLNLCPFIIYPLSTSSLSLPWIFDLSVSLSASLSPMVKPVNKAVKDSTLSDKVETTKSTSVHPAYYSVFLLMLL